VLKAILFDFDGTLADSFQAIAASVNFIRQKVGKDSLAFPEIKKHVGYGLDQLLRNMVQIETRMTLRLNTMAIINNTCLT